MKTKEIYKNYLIIAILPLIGLFKYQPFPNMVKGYVIGMILSFGQIANSVFKGINIADKYGRTNSKATILSPSMFLPFLIIGVALILVHQFLGQGALYTCATALLLQKPALLLTLNKFRRKGGVN